MSKLLCIDVTRQAWNDEKIMLENEDIKVILHIKKPEDHGQFQKGEEYEILSNVTKKELKKKSKK